MTKILFSAVALAALSGSSLAQTFEVLDTNNIAAGMNADGDLFWDLANPQFEAPAGSGIHAIYAANLWIGALDANNSLHLAANEFRSTGTDYWAGPVANTYNAAHENKYNRVWKLSQAQIDKHASDYASAGYVAPDAITNWPGNGNAANGEAALLASFADKNGNSVYEPNLGDVPIIRGDQAVYMIFNDDKAAHAQTGGEKLKMEIHALAYSFSDSPNEAIHNTIFVHYRLINRSANDYKDLYLGVWADFDLGDPLDDYVGCDSMLNSFFVYNGANYDGSYTFTPPAVGATILNQKLASFRTHNFSLQTAGPFTPLEHYYHLKNLWNDGSQTVYGGNGHVSHPLANPAITTNFMFPGTVDDTLQWNESTAGHFPGDRMGLGSVGPMDVNSEQELCLDLAFTFARDTNSMASVSKLKLAIDDVQNFFDAYPQSCSNVVAGIEEVVVAEAEIRMYPNPTTGVVTVPTGQKKPQDLLVHIFDASGQLVLKSNYKTSMTNEGIAIDLTNLERGIYLVQLNGSYYSNNQRIIKL